MKEPKGEDSSMEKKMMKKKKLEGEMLLLPEKGLI